MTCESVSVLDGCRCEREPGHGGTHEHIHDTGRPHWWAGAGQAEAMSLEDIEATQ